jgi:hypothetical protein
LTPADVEKPLWNYVGVAIAVLSGVIFLGIRVNKKDERETLSDSRPVNASMESVPLLDDPPAVPRSTLRMRVIACFLAIVAGVLFGLVFTPSTYIQDHRNDKYPGASKNGLHYIFSMLTGILPTSIVYFAIYIAVKRNRPYVHVPSILPGFISGVMWGIAQAGFLLTNSVLSQAICFPLISIGPATVATLWSIFYLKDIRGSRNFLIFLLGSFLRIVAAALIILSKPILH